MKEEKATDFKLLDSSIWIAYFFEGYHKDLIENGENLLISTLSIFETKKRLIKKGVPDKEINEKIKFVKQRSLSIPLTDTISEKAATISAENKTPALDSLIYTTATDNSAILVTQDNDFRGLENVEIININ